MSAGKAMNNVLVIGKIHDAGMAILHSRHDLNVVSLEDPGATIPRHEVARADAILIRYGILSAEAIQLAPRLRIVSRHGVGCDNLPVVALSARGIPVMTVGPVSAISVAEQTIAMLLAAAKNITAYDSAVRKGHWAVRDSITAFELNGKVLLLLGFGRIGREVAKRARAFGMTVLAYDPNVGSEEMAVLDVEKAADWRAILPTVDVLSLHVPLGKATQHLIDATALELCKSSAVIINTSRGGLIDEAALHRALTTRLREGAAALDTFQEEPMKMDHPFCGLPNVVLSPHSAALTREGSMRLGVVSAQNVLAGLDGTMDPTLVFNRAALSALPVRHRNDE